MLRGMDDLTHDHHPAKLAPMDPRRGPFRSQRAFNNILASILGAPEADYRAFYAYVQLGQIGGGSR